MGTAIRQSSILSHARLIGIALLAASLAACSGNSGGKHSSRSKEYFPESKYGVKASPRVAHAKSKLPRGGGRYQVGKPYKIKGNWFHPKEDPNYKAVGVASWYGDAFHGRLTANGEIYDMTHLTAAHPTLPLPSYARVTNLENNSSVVVRINDRGPFEKNRLIDLSRRAAELLGFHQKGSAKVKVEYVGPAPLHGQDDAFLMASYRPGGRAPDPSDGLPTGVMLAMNGPTPTPAAQARAVADPISAVINSAPVAAQADPAFSAFQQPSDVGIALPASAPIPQMRPETYAVAALSYAEQRVSAAFSVFEPILAEKKAPVAQQAPANLASGAGKAEYVNLGVWSSIREAEAVAKSLSHYGRIEVEPAGATEVALTLATGEGIDIDDALRAAWAAGATDAFIVRE